MLRYERKQQMKAKIDARSSGMPTLYTGEMVDEIADLCIRAVKSGLPLRQVPSIFLWGQPGIGKSEGIKQAAQKIEEAVGKRVVLTDIRLLLFSPVDLRGIPVADPARESALWLKPKIFAMDSSDDVINLLLLDELTAAPQSMQAAAYQICLDRRVGEHKLPDNCLVMAAGNRTTDRSVAFQMPKALCSRLLHFNVEPDFKDWKKWAERENIDERIIQFLEKDPSRLVMEPRISDIAYPSPRTWSFVSRILSLYPEGIRKQVPLIASAVGLDCAMEFASFCSGYGMDYSLDQILKGECRAFPKSADQLFALCQSLQSQLAARKTSLKATQMDNLASYVSHFPPDYAQSLFQVFQTLPCTKKVLITSPLYKEWKKKYGESFSG